MHRLSCQIVPQSAWCRQVAMGVWGGVFIVASVVVMRSLAGAFEASVADAAICGITAIATCINLAAHWLYHNASESDRFSAMHRLVTGMLTLLPPAALGIALASGMSTIVVVFSLGLFCVASVILVVFPGRDRVVASTNSVTTLRSLVEEDDRLAESPVAQGMSRNDVVTLQQVTRTRDDSGCEALNGIFFVHFAAGEKTSSIHIPLCPAFASVPVVEHNFVDGCDVRLKVGQRYCHGVRIDARRSRRVEESATAIVEICLRETE